MFAAGSPQLASSVPNAMTHIINSERSFLSFVFLFFFFFSFFIIFSPLVIVERIRRDPRMKKRACVCVCVCSRWGPAESPTGVLVEIENATLAMRARERRSFTVGDHANLLLYTQEDGSRIRPYVSSAMRMIRVALKRTGRRA